MSFLFQIQWIALFQQKLKTGRAVCLSTNVNRSKILCNAFIGSYKAV